LRKVIGFKLSPKYELRFSQRSIRDEYVDKLWEKREAHHFNGQIVSLKSYSPDLLIGEMIDYRVWYACVKKPSLQRVFDIHPLSVSGRVISGGKILVGRRSQKVTTHKGCLECCPSGTLEGESPEEAMRAELEEETGITAVRKILPKQIYWSVDDGTWDIHMDLFCENNLPTPPPTKEYEEFFWFDPKEKRGDKWVPLSEQFLQVPI
jgi:ADP-ribose pyrophosphatase YjhB (NUDIX family)